VAGSLPGDRESGRRGEELKRGIIYLYIDIT